MEQDRTVTPERRGAHQPALVDWGRVARRLAVASVVWIAVVVVGASITASIASGSTTGVWLGIGAGGLVVTTIVVVAGSALVGMLRAGDRGDRLAGDDVGLIPPQARRRWWRGRGRA